MLRLLAVFAFAFVGTTLGTTALAQAGYVHELSGIATVQGKDGKQQTLKAGDLVNVGQTISTGDKSSAVVKFEDGQLMALQAQSAFRIDQYSYNKQKVAESSTALNFLRGGLRYVSGVIGATRPQQVRIAAGNATIGIRGTDVSVVVDATTQAIQAMAVNIGTALLANPQGSIVVTPGLIVSVQANQAPAQVPITSVSALATASIQALQKTALPVNTPVVVVSAARAAFAVAQLNQAKAAAAAAPANSPQQLLLLQAVAAADKTAQAAIATAVTDAVAAFNTAIEIGRASCRERV